MNDYNFFASYQRRKSIEFNIKSPFMISSIIVLISVFLLMGIVLQNYMLNRQITLQTKKIEQMQKDENYIRADEAQKSLVAMNQYTAGADTALKKFQQSQIIDSELINAFMKGIPTTAVVQNFNADSSVFTIVCSVQDRKAAAELVLALEGTGACENLHLTSVAANTSGSGYIAEITGGWKEGAAK